LIAVMLPGLAVAGPVLPEGFVHLRAIDPTIVARSLAVAIANARSSRIPDTAIEGLFAEPAGTF
jgi:hypothetical protein